MIFGIIGYGIVGKATHKSVVKSNSVVIHDTKLNTNVSELSQCDVIFFCIPTVTQSDVDSIQHYITEIHQINKECEFVIRSTVPIGSSRVIQQSVDASVFYMPEFLRDRSWESDCLKRPFILGSHNHASPSWLSADEFLLCSFEEAESIKMLSNNISAMKVVFANHMYDIAQCVDADYEKIVTLYKQIEHVDQHYISVSENLRGFGGKCLPKDLDFLLETFNQLGLEQSLFTAIKKDNLKWPITVKEY